MRYRKFGATDLEVSEIGFGAWAIGGPGRLGPNETGWGDTDDAVSLRTLEACLDYGINFIDTSDAYGNGHSEELVAQAFKGKRHQVVICTKGGNRTMPDGTWKKDFSPEWIRSACEASLKRLQTDYIDIYLYHTPRGEMAFIPEEFDVLRQLQQEGKIRHYGISVDTVADGMKTLAYPDNAEGIQVVYNILEREAELEFFPKARQLGVGIIARVPLASGFLTGKYTADVTFPPNDHRSRIPRDVIEQRVNQVEKLRELIADDDRTLAQLALQFCLAHPAVSTVIPGAKTPEQLADNARAGELPPLTDDERNRIRDLFPLKS